MPLWRLHYHIVWATKNRELLIRSSLETQLYNYITHKSLQYGCVAHAVNGMSDHIHVIVSIMPTLAVSEYIRKIKGSSSHFINQIDSEKFAWQNGYGVFSISENNLSIAINYVKNQKQHHSNNTIVKILETIES